MSYENMIDYLNSQSYKRLKHTKMLGPSIVIIVGLILPLTVFFYLWGFVLCACLLTFVSLSLLVVILLYNFFHINKNETIEDNLIINSIFYLSFTTLFALLSLSLSIFIELDIFLQVFIFLLPYIMGGLYIAISAYRLKKAKNTSKAKRIGSHAIWLGYFTSILFLRPFISSSKLESAFFIAIICCTFLASIFATRTDKLLELYCVNKLKSMGYNIEKFK